MDAFNQKCSIYVINLNTRDDRMEHIQNEFARVGIKNYEVCRFDRHPVHGATGMFTNSILILEKGLANGKPILIFEDDVIFRDDRLHLLQAIKKFMDIQSPEDWDTIRLGYSKPMFLEPVNDFKGWYRGNCVSTEAVIFSIPFARRLVAKYKGNIPLHVQYDVQMAKVTGRTIIPVDPITIQGPFVSDNVWPNPKHQEAFLRDPEAYMGHFIRIGQRYQDSLLPGWVVYWILMAQFFRLKDIVGWNPRMWYETRPRTNLPW
jgi:hypothetical protein